MAAIQHKYLLSFADGELTVVATTEDRNGTVISDTDDLLKTDTDQDPATPNKVA
ncbi:hypothetical protein [Acinetobacter lanii]|uniref:hypothetical protein n=1 Tax=Acinetobacter lanii TaxID=2715163 RepID=UPI001D0ECA7F|nr:hypothetical protein [Acinetobacter lanii]